MYSKYLSFFMMSVPVVFFVLSVIGFLFPKWRRAPWILLALALVCYIVAWDLSAKHPDWFLTATDPETGETWEVDIEGSDFMGLILWIPAVPIGYALAWGMTWPWTRRRPRAPKVPAGTVWKWRPKRWWIALLALVVVSALRAWLLPELGIISPFMLFLALSIVTAATDRGWAPSVRVLWVYALQIIPQVIDNSLYRLTEQPSLIGMLPPFLLCLPFGALAMRRSKLFVHPVVPPEVSGVDVDAGQASM